MMQALQLHLLRTNISRFQLLQCQLKMENHKVNVKITGNIVSKGQSKSYKNNIAK